MRRAAAVIVLTVAAAVTAAGQQTFKTAVDLVHFSVVVTDKDGVPVPGLTADDFEVRERGVEQSIKFFAAGDGEAAPPLHLGFLLDASGSMETDMKDVRTAAIKFLNAVERIEDVTLVDFDTEVRVARFGPNDHARLIERIRVRKPDGWTAFYDAFGTYLHTASTQTGQKIAVVFTDGGDTRSAMNRSELIELLKVSDVTVYTIGYLEQQTQSAKIDQQALLSRLSKITGGQAFFPTSIKDIDKMYEKILNEIAGRYSLGYTSSDMKMDGAWRQVEVRLKRKDLKGVKLRTREGYFAPYKPSLP